MDKKYVKLTLLAKAP